MGRLTINLGAIARNYKIIQTAVNGGSEVGAVLKANAYGLGAREVARALYSAGCRTFFVAKPFEYEALQDLPADRKLLILNGFYKSHADLYAQNNLTPVLGSFAEIENYKTLAKVQGRALPAFLKFNIRMNRLGLSAMEAEEILDNMQMLEGLDIKGIMGHFACADEAQHPMNETQYEAFSELAKKFELHYPDLQKSLCNSSGIFRDPKYHFDLVRPGMALYGLNPTPEKPNPMEAVVSVNLPVLRTRIVHAGASVGYGGAYEFEKDTPLATVSAGYADGIFRSLGNKGKLYWKGYPCPIRGRISMDLTTVDLSAVPEGQRPKPGDALELLGPNQSADDLAASAGTIGYEILTALGQRYERVYVG